MKKQLLLFAMALLSSAVMANDSITARLDRLERTIVQQNRQLKTQNDYLVYQNDSLNDAIELIQNNQKSLEQKISRMPKISGFLQLSYQYNYFDNVSSINVTRARMKISGDLLPQLDYAMQVEFNTPKVLDFYMRYKPFTQFNIQAGMFKLPFSIENTQYGPLNSELIDAPLALARLVGFNDVCGMRSTGRDVGVNFYGTFFPSDRGFSYLRYDVGVYNGSGIAIKDNNMTKDISARVMVYPIKKLLISGSYYWGEYGDNYVKRTRFAAGASYDNILILRSEFIGGNTGGVKSGGLFVTAGAHLPKGFDVAARYDIYQDDRANTNTRQQDCLVGLVWHYYKPLRMQLNYNYTNYFGARDDNHSFAFMISGMF